MATPGGDPPRSPSGAPTRGFTQPIFIAKHGRRGRRVRSVSWGMALLAASWIVAVTAGGFGFLFLRDSATSAVALPARSAQCPGQLAAGDWRATRDATAGGQGGNWSVYVYAATAMSPAQLRRDCGFAQGWVRRITRDAGEKPRGPAGWECRQYRGPESLVKQSLCQTTGPNPQRAFAWYPDTTHPYQPPS